jgi:hypothetical protein
MAVPTIDRLRCVHCVSRSENVERMSADLIAARIAVEKLREDRAILIVVCAGLVVWILLLITK